jgi:hypothetical protein
MEVFEKNDPSCMISKKWENSQLNGRVLSKIMGMKIKVAPMKRDYLYQIMLILVGSFNKY